MSSSASNEVLLRTNIDGLFLGMRTRLRLHTAHARLGCARAPVNVQLTFLGSLISFEWDVNDLAQVCVAGVCKHIHFLK